MWSSARVIQFSRGAAILACLCTAPALAQENQEPAPQQETQTQNSQRYWDCVSPLCTFVEPQQGTKTQSQQPYGGGTPLDVILNTRLWTDVPEAQGFVKATRPSEDTLKYQPTAGKDIVRPKLRTPAELKVMEDELERAGAAADRAAGFKNKNFHVEAKRAASAPTKPIDRSEKAAR
jgi:hypothetical protein